MSSAIIYVILGVIVLFAFGSIAMFVSWYKKVPQGKALIRTGIGGTQVAIDSAMFVVPILHQVETLDLTNRIIDIELSGRDSLICKDNIKADLKVDFHLRVNAELMDIVRVAQSIGATKASDIEYIKTLFGGKFRETVITLGSRRTFEDLYRNLESFKLELLQSIDMDLNGFLIDDCTIEYIRKVDK